MSEHTSAWKSIVDDWVAREGDLRPSAPIDPSSVEVRDAVEIGDAMFVLVSFDVKYPWPQEEDASSGDRARHTAVIQASRVRQPWLERDASRSGAQLETADGKVVIHEHTLGDRRAWSGFVSEQWQHVSLQFEDGSRRELAVVDGWFLAVEPELMRLHEVHGPADSSYCASLERRDTSDLLGSMELDRPASQVPYFSPLDLRAVHPLVRWQREGNIVIVASSLEQYDEGGILRLRIDGVRADDDLFMSWPEVVIDADGVPVQCAPCAEFAHKDTVTLDIGFTPWVPPTHDHFRVIVRGLRGASGSVEPITLELAARDYRS